MYLTESNTQDVRCKCLKVKDDLNNGLQVKSGQCKPNKQALLSQTYSVSSFWLNLAFQIKSVHSKMPNLESFDQL